jgi:hypothetical protein
MTNEQQDRERQLGERLWFGEHVLLTGSCS